MNTKNYSKPNQEHFNIIKRFNKIDIEFYEKVLEFKNFKTNSLD